MLCRVCCYAFLPLLASRIAVAATLTGTRASAARLHAHSEIPHSLFSKEEPRLCLFVKDPSTAVEEELEKSPVEGFAKVRGGSCCSCPCTDACASVASHAHAAPPNVADTRAHPQVMSYSTLRKNYTRYKDRRELCSSYDAFFSDDRILPMMPRLLGKVR